MSVAWIKANSDDLVHRVDRRPYDSPLGYKMIVPGWPQFSWGQRQRGLVLVGSFAVALTVGLWTWGTVLGLGVLCLRVYHAGDVRGRCPSSGLVPDPSPLEWQSFSSQVSWHSQFTFPQSSFCPRSPGPDLSPTVPAVVSW